MNDFETTTPNKKKIKASATPDLQSETHKNETEIGFSQNEAETEASEDVKKVKYDQEELLRIFDDMIFAGTYSETITIRGKLKVTFTTRTAEQMDTITRKVDSTSAVLMATLVEKRNLLNLYYALTNYQGTDLSGLKYEDKVSFINKLPAPIVGMLMVALFKFDQKISAATKEGESNF